MSVISNPTYDVELELKDAGLIATSAAAQVGGSAKVIDTGAAVVGWNAPMGPSNRIGPIFKADLVVYVSAIEIASNDEIYDIVLQGSPDAAFGTAANIQELFAISLSAKEVKRTDSDKDDVVGTYIIPIYNVHGGVVYRYLRLYTVVDGTIATGINYTGRLAIMNGP